MRQRTLGSRIGDELISGPLFPRWAPSKLQVHARLWVSQHSTVAFSFSSLPSNQRDRSVRGFLKYLLTVRFCILGEPLPTVLIDGRAPDLNMRWPVGHPLPHWHPAPSQYAFDPRGGPRVRSSPSVLDSYSGKFSRASGSAVHVKAKMRVESMSCW